MTITFEGRCSTFGGRGDAGMRVGEGLAYFEHDEADLRPDLFLPRGDPIEGASQRLRPEAFYLALPVAKGSAPRFLLAGSPWHVMNPKTGQSVLCSLVDWGPNPNTGRVCDLSPGAARALRLVTDDLVRVCRA